MKTNATNLFIVDDSLLELTSLRSYLDEKFDGELNIFTFLTGASALKKLDKNTGIVILDNDLKNEDGNEILRSIKALNPNTQVIVFGSNEEVSSAIEAIRKGATDYIVKGKKAWKKISVRVGKMITYPISVMKTEFGIPRHLAIFLLTFLSVGIVTCIYFNY